METKFVITATIYDHKYFLRIIESGTTNQSIVYEGIEDNSTIFENEDIANAYRRSLDSEFILTVEPFACSNISLPRVPLHERIRELRMSTGKSQEQTAAALNIQRGTYQSYEDGRGGPSLNTIITLAKYFDISIEELVKGKTTYVDNAK